MNNSPMSGHGKRIFHEIDLWTEIENRKGQITSAIRRASKEQLGEGSNEDVAASFATDYLIPENVSAAYDNPAYEDDEVDFRDEDFGRRVTRRVQRLRFFVPVSGQLEILSFSPTSGPISYPSAVELEGDNLVFTYLDHAGVGATGIKKQFEIDLTTVRQGLENLKGQLKQQNAILKQHGAGDVGRRRAQLASQEDAVKSMGIPRRSDQSDDKN